MINGCGAWDGLVYAKTLDREFWEATPEKEAISESLVRLRTLMEVVG